MLLVSGCKTKLYTITIAATITLDCSCYYILWYLYVVPISCRLSCVHYCDCKGTARLCRFASRRTKLQLLQRVFQRMLTNYLLIYAILTFKTAAVPFHQDYRQESPRSCERGLSMSFPAPLRPKQVRAKLPKCSKVFHCAARYKT